LDNDLTILLASGLFIWGYASDFFLIFTEIRKKSGRLKLSIKTGSTMKHTGRNPTYFSAKVIFEESGELRVKRLKIEPEPYFSSY